MIKTVNDISEINIGEDVRRDIGRRLSRDNLKKAERTTLEKVDEIKNRDTKSGKSPAKGGRWDNVYNKRYARRQRKPRSPVTLRSTRSSKTIERTRVRSGSKGSTLEFKDRRKAVIFGYHDRGIRYPKKGFTQRQIYPAGDAQVPDAVDATAENAIFRILNG